MIDSVDAGWGREDIFEPTKNKVLFASPVIRVALTSNAAQVDPPGISVSPSSFDFGNEVVGQTSPPETFTVTNTGTIDLFISLVMITGLNATEFHITSDNCTGSTLTSRANCGFAVVFAPVTVGPKVSSLMVSFSFPLGGGVTEVPLRGTGVAATPLISVSPASFDFGDVAVGQTSPPESFVVTNTGTADLLIFSGTAIGQNAAQFHIT